METERTATAPTLYSVPISGQASSRGQAPGPSSTEPPTHPPPVMPMTPHPPAVPTAPHPAPTADRGHLQGRPREWWLHPLWSLLSGQSPCGRHSTTPRAGPSPCDRATPRVPPCLVLLRRPSSRRASDDSGSAPPPGTPTPTPLSPMAKGWDSTSLVAAFNTMAMTPPPPPTRWLTPMHPTTPPPPQARYLAPIPPFLPSLDRRWERFQAVVVYARDCERAMAIACEHKHHVVDALTSQMAEVKRLLLGRDVVPSPWLQGLTLPLGSVPLTSPPFMLRLLESRTFGRSYPLSLTQLPPIMLAGVSSAPHAPAQHPQRPCPRQPRLPATPIIGPDGHPLVSHRHAHRQRQATGHRRRGGGARQA